MIALYDEPSTTAKPLATVPSGTELNVDPGMIEGMEFFPGTPLYCVSDDFYWVSYNYHIYLVKAKEVSIEWL